MPATIDSDENARFMSVASAFTQARVVLARGVCVYAGPRRAGTCDRRFRRPASCWHVWSAVPQARVVLARVVGVYAR
jgi:hypothetical protein